MYNIIMNNISSKENEMCSSLHNNSGESIRIETAEDLIALQKCILTEKNKLFFRGQSNIGKSEYSSKWSLSSTLRRRIYVKLPDYEIDQVETICNFTNDLYENITKHKQGSDYNLISILSKMQHNGIETMLIDFTNSFEKSLWFAFDNVPNFINIKELKLDKRYSTIYIKKHDENYRPHRNIKPEELKNTEGIIAAPNNITRAISQNSFFLLDNMKSTDDIIEVLIAHSLKEEIDKLLNRKMINAETIFPDIHGVFTNHMKSSEALMLYEAVNIDSNTNDRINSIKLSICKLEYIVKKQKDYKIETNVVLYERYDSFIDYLIENDFYNTDYDEDETKYWLKSILIHLQRALEIMSDILKHDVSKFTNHKSSINKYHTFIINLQDHQSQEMENVKSKFLDIYKIIQEGGING